MPWLVKHAAYLLNRYAVLQYTQTATPATTDVGSTLLHVTNNAQQTNDISTAFLHAKAATDDLFMFPPTEFYNPEDQVVWKLNKAIYGLRSSPHAWQKHLAETLQQLGVHRLASEPNVFKTATGNAFVLCYVDDLLFWENQQQ